MLNTGLSGANYHRWRAPVSGKIVEAGIIITEISSVMIQAKVGQKVKKGDELGYFSYGGSTLCLAFRPKAVKNFTVKVPSGSIRAIRSMSMLKLRPQIENAIRREA